MRAALIALVVLVSVAGCGDDEGATDVTEPADSAGLSASEQADATDAYNTLDQFCAAALNLPDEVSDAEARKAQDAADRLADFAERSPDDVRDLLGLLFQDGKRCGVLAPLRDIPR